MTPSTLLHPLKLDVVGFQEDEHDYHFRVEPPEPKCCVHVVVLDTHAQISKHFLKTNHKKVYMLLNVSYS